ncbi:MAG: ABC transporter ATP-binding protein [Acidocella sp. 20-57-95]|nr:MAG: ABC transporter ATP-binding protein [Acidocella sp. 20-57-95]HQT64404.1 ATP-binding cassette domain-containing protein [Acidocella sp.]
MNHPETILSVEKISVSLQGRPILDNINFDLAKAEFCGLIGANGSGKTTLLRTILGFQPHTHGTINIDHRPNTNTLKSVGYVPQKIQLEKDLPLRARDLIGLGWDGHRLGLPWPSRKKSILVDEMLHAVNAEAFADQRVGDLSGGQQQRILIAHALIHRPKLLLLDEPLANLDIRAVAETVALLNRVRIDFGVAILISAHDMNPLLGVVDKIIYLANGRAAYGRTNEVVRTTVLSELYGYHIDVIRVHGRVLVIAGGHTDENAIPHDHHQDHVEAIP